MGRARNQAGSANRGRFRMKKMGKGWATQQKRFAGKIRKRQR